MKYLEFKIKNYKAIAEEVSIPINPISLLPLIGANESGKTSILQAIHAFDFSNDRENDGTHLSDIRNLYQPMKEEPSSITALIKISHQELLSILEEEDIERNPDLGKGGKLSITREVFDKDRSHYIVDGIADREEGNRIGNKIVAELPFIIYNDDFIERPDSMVEVPLEEPQQLSGWLGIYAKAFQAAGYSIFSVVDQETNFRNSALSDVSVGINEMLIEEWARISLDDGKCLKIHLGFSDRKLEIKIVETINNRERFFDISERSKGFLWFFNFVMKIRYNPKGTGQSSDIVYLLDEPGSYLHASAQEKLCKMLKSISNKDGKVIYCTHTHHLLDPKYIPIKNIYLVRKSNNGVVSLARAIDAPTKTKKNNELQPVFEALQIADWDFFRQSERVVLVEGIYDKYAIEFFCGQKKNTVIFPGTSASSIYERIPQCIAYEKDYVALWDNDKEGKAYYEKACNKFGAIEKQKFHCLPCIKEKRQVRMETFIGQDALDAIVRELQMPQNSTYEKTMLALVGIEEKERRTLLRAVPQETITRFDELASFLFT